jgi:hypothetical protein
MEAMKRAIQVLFLVGMLVGAVLVVWELVAKPGPLRKGWWAIRARVNPVYEARIQFNLRQPITDEQLQAENKLLDGEEVLMTVIKDLKLAETWQVSGESAAVKQLAQNSELRRGENEFVLILAVRDPDRELAGKIAEPLGRSFVAIKQQQAAAGLPGGGTTPPDQGP